MLSLAAPHRGMSTQVCDDSSDKVHRVVKAALEGAAIGGAAANVGTYFFPAPVAATPSPIRRAAAAGASGGLAVLKLAGPALTAVGFTSKGIAAGSAAAKMMSIAAIANGGGVAAGGTVATLQSIGAAGFALSTGVMIISACGAVGASYAAATAVAPVVTQLSVTAVVLSGACAGAAIKGVREHFRSGKVTWGLAEKFSDSEERFRDFKDDEESKRAFEKSHAAKKMLVIGCTAQEVESEQPEEPTDHQNLGAGAGISGVAVAAAATLMVAAETVLAAATASTAAAGAGFVVVPVAAATPGTFGIAAAAASMVTGATTVVPGAALWGAITSFGVAPVVVPASVMAAPIVATGLAVTGIAGLAAVFARALTNTARNEGESSEGLQGTEDGEPEVTS